MLSPLPSTPFPLRITARYFLPIPWSPAHPLGASLVPTAGQVCLVEPAAHMAQTTLPSEAPSSCEASRVVVTS